MTSKPDGPWRPDEVLPLVDFSGEMPWHGRSEPDPIEAGAAPGGLIARQLTDDGTECRRWILSPTSVQRDVEEAVMALDGVPGSFIAIHDGDTGRAVLTLQA